MKDLTLNIRPLEGFGELEFGTNKEEVTKYFGEPNEEEIFSDEEDGDTLVYHYWDKDVSAFFENLADPVLINLETDNPDATLFGKHIFTLKETEVKELMKANGYSEIDEELMESEEFDNEKRVSFDDAMMDFFFEEEMLTAVSWGVFLDEFDDE
ncbi:MAG: hypothetical protein B6D64_02170 [Bacteroidetes bacterium 4484_276]|nr:MAG: hypothetical protein B6D64_02170 [Bacteroidetes bacterium 4484_276]